MKKIKSNKTDKLQKQMDEFSEVCKTTIPVLFKYATDPIIIPKEKQKLIKKFLTIDKKI